MSTNPVSTALTGLRELAHFLVPVAGLITGSAASIELAVGHLGVSGNTTASVIAAVGYGVTLLSKFIDSRSFTDIQTAAAATSVPAVAAALDAAAVDATPALVPVMTAAAPPAPPAVGPNGAPLA